MTTDLTVTSEDFDSIAKYYTAPDARLNWNLVFTIPSWLRVWWENFGAGAELYLRAIRQQDRVIGIAPLQTRNGTASIIGSINVCDYQDFIVSAGWEKDFYKAMLHDLRQKGVHSLDLEPVRPDSTIATYLIPIARELKFRVNNRQTDISLDMDLPQNWNEYLRQLDGKQRHELRRKIRNLQDIGETGYRVIEDKLAISGAIDKFLKLFPESRNDKAQFMTTGMQNYFRSLTVGLADSGIVKFGALELGEKDSGYDHVFRLPQQCLFV